MHKPCTKRPFVVQYTTIYELCLCVRGLEVGGWRLSSTKGSNMKEQQKIVINLYIIITFDYKELCILSKFGFICPKKYFSTLWLRVEYTDTGS